MKYEVEQKFPLSQLDTVEQSLRALGGAFAAQVAQADCYFAHPARDFAETDEALRIRRVGDSNRVTYKGPRIDTVTKTRREVEIPLAEGEQVFMMFRELLASLGFTFVAEVRKLRRCATVSWRGTTIEAALDVVEGLGQFLELELIAEDDGLEEAKSKIASLAEHLNLAQTEQRSYLELLLESRGDAG